MYFPLFLFFGSSADPLPFDGHRVAHLYVPILPSVDLLDLAGEAFVPHVWLLPRCRGIVHHGGSGTTGAALRCVTLDWIGLSAFYLFVC